MPAANPLDWGAPAGAVEQIVQRTLHSKTFKNPDGSHTTVFGRVLHYEASPGVWEDASRDFRADGSDWVADQLPFTIRLSGTSLDATLKNGKGLRFPIPPGAVVSGNRIAFSWGSIDWNYHVTKAGLKLSAVVHNRIGAKTFTFPYTRLGGAGALTVNPDGSISGDGFLLPRPFVVGADRVVYPCGSWELVGSTQIRFTWDDTALPTIAFPYTLDPSTTFSIGVDADDGYVTRDSTSTEYPPAGSYYVSVDGETSFWTERSWSTFYRTVVSLLRWNTASLPDDATITAATLRLYLINKTNGDSRAISADWYDAGTRGTEDWTNTAGTNAHNGTAISSLTTSADNDLALTNLSNVSKTGYTGVRLHVTGGQPAGSNKAEWADFAHSTLAEPRLIVTYTTRFARPSADISTGGWGTAPLWEKLDEVDADDTDSIQTGAAPNNETFEVRLSALDSPNAGTVRLKYRYSKDQAAQQEIQITAKLFQGSTEIASWSHSNVSDTWTTATQALTQAQRDSITDWGNLRFRGIAHATTSATGGNRRRGRFSWVELSTPPLARTVTATANLTIAKERGVPATARLQSTLSRSVAANTALKGTLSRSVTATASLSSVGKRTVTAAAFLELPNTRTTSATIALSSTNTRQSPATAAIRETIKRAVPLTAQLKRALWFRPAEDITVGSWAATPPGSLFDTINETESNASDYITGTGSSEFKLEFAGTPRAGTRTLRYQYQKTTADPTNLTVELVQGTLILQTWTHNDIPQTLTTAEQTITANVTNWADLRIRFTASG